jgi:hypothetical protein
MSLYRQAGRAGARTLILAAVAALLVGLVAGFALGRSTAPEETLAAKVADLQRRVRPAEEGLELTATEYGQAVRGGRIVAPTEYQAAQADVRRAGAAIAAARIDLRALSPQRAAALDRSVAAVRAAVGRRAAAADVRRLSDEARAELRAAVGR